MQSLFSVIRQDNLLKYTSTTRQRCDEDIEKMIDLFQVHELVETTTKYILGTLTQALLYNYD